MSERQIRSFVRRVLESSVIDEDDEQEGEEKDEVSAGGVAGVSTPLGTGPSYPNREKSRRVPPYVAAGKAFGNAKLKKKKRK
ncbi:MAG: hypothetical protein CMA72_06850 [Euryarchaeota archaeon]|nr:hypothetical protein [Euryarchaeota archaeon]|tara:strand:+ start:5160 stop:5405 length:246 start_codon:yes stop_codon:yes gene_type:complete